MKFLGAKIEKKDFLAPLCSATWGGIDPFLPLCRSRSRHRIDSSQQHNKRYIYAFTEETQSRYIRRGWRKRDAGREVRKIYDEGLIRERYRKIHIQGRKNKNKAVARLGRLTVDVERDSFRNGRRDSVVCHAHICPHHGPSYAVQSQDLAVISFHFWNNETRVLTLTPAHMPEELQSIHII